MNVIGEICQLFLLNASTRLALADYHWLQLGASLGHGSIESRAVFFSWHEEMDCLLSLAVQSALAVVAVGKLCLIHIGHSIIMSFHHERAEAIVMKALASISVSLKCFCAT